MITTQLAAVTEQLKSCVADRALIVWHANLVQQHFGRVGHYRLQQNTRDTQCLQAQILGVVGVHVIQ